MEMEWRVGAGGASRSQVVGMAVGVMEGRGGGGKICGNLEELHLSAAPWGTVHDPSNHNPLRIPTLARFVEVVRRDWPVTWRFAVPWEVMQIPSLGRIRVSCLFISSREWSSSWVFSFGVLKLWRSR